jgi:hypothetical protein
MICLLWFLQSYGCKREIVLLEIKLPLSPALHPAHPIRSIRLHWLAQASFAEVRKAMEGVEKIQSRLQSARDQAAQTVHKLNEVNQLKNIGKPHDTSPIHCYRPLYV